jgi:hypothetical protein
VCTPIILPTQEVEIYRITVPCQPGQKVSETPISIHRLGAGYGDGLSDIPATGGIGRRYQSEAVPRQKTLI